MNVPLTRKKKQAAIAFKQHNSVNGFSPVFLSDIVTEIRAELSAENVDELIFLAKIFKLE